MVVPNGSTVIQQGDILVVSDQSHIKEDKKKERHEEIPSEDKTEIMSEETSDNDEKNEDSDKTADIGNEETIDENTEEKVGAK